MRRLTIGLAFAIVLFVSGCSRAPESAKPKSVATDSFKTDADVTVRVAGATSINYTGKATIIIYRTLDDRVPLHLRLFSVGLAEPGVELNKGVTFRSAFDVLGFKGDGSYTIDRTILSSVRPSGVNLPSGIQSNAFVQIFEPADPNSIQRWDVALEPCRVQARDRARHGSLSCTKLRGDQNATTVTLEMTWDAR